MSKGLSRRDVLRGAIAGGAVALHLPLLDCFFDNSGTALAGGVPIPIRFGTWFWGNGMNPDRWNPQLEGADYELPIELAAIAGVRDRINVLSGFDVKLDGTPNTPHESGVLSTLTGTAPAREGDVPAPTVDTLIADAIGTTTRFRSLELSATGNREHSYSRASQSLSNPSEISPVELYARVFGPEFHDPRDGEFMPDPRLLLRKSVLSAVTDDRQRLERELGAHDRQRVDEYFTAVRQLEQQLDILLSGPPDLAACTRPDAPAGEDVGTEVGQVVATHDALTDILVLALACDQTRVFNMVFSWGLSELRTVGSNISHHQLTHDELIDAELGYQPLSTEFVLVSMQTWAGFLAKLANVTEGAGTLLDNCLVMAHSESALAKTHDVSGLPVMLAGSAGGRVRTGLHVNGAGEPISRIGLTAQLAMGLSVQRWGTRSMDVSQPVTELLAG